MATDFRFAEVATQEFEFLLERGFHLTKADEIDAYVEYRSELYVIIVFRDRDGVGLGIRSAENERNCGFTFNRLIRKFDQGADARLPALDMVSNDKEALDRLKLMAENIKQHVDFRAFDTTDLFNELSADARTEFEQRYPSVSLEVLQARFHQLWEGQHYAELLKQFGVLSEHLTEDERRKLEIARRAVGEAGHA